MITIIVKDVFEKKEKIEKIVKMLKKDAVGILPTDTLYGISSSAFSEKGVRRIFELKKRDFEKKFILLASDLEMVKKYTELTYEQIIFLDKIWPASLTIIAKAKNLPAYLLANNGTIAFRVPAHSIKKLIKKLDCPIASPSANPEGFAPAKNIADMEDYFSEKLDFIGDYGTINNTEPSTIISFYPENKIIRNGILNIKFKDNFFNLK